VLAFIIWQRKNITKRKIIATLIVLLLIFVAHRTMDIYLGLSFFDLQTNWHYVAYCAYAFYFFRAFYARNFSPNRMIILAYFSTLMMSLFDETFQLFMSDRVFDVSDIAKDALGIYIGLITVLFIAETYGSISISFKSLPQKRLLDYLRKPLASIITLGILTISFILLTPLLTEYEYCLTGVLLSIGLSAFLMMVIYISRYRIFRIISLLIIAIMFIFISFSLINNWQNNLSFKKPGLIFYRGIPLPYFDFIVFPNGYCHLIDKKKYFRSTDRDYLLRQKPDIVLIGAGENGSGGKGFDQGIGTHFIFNRYTLRGTQIVILPTSQICEKYNLLKKKGKSVLAVMHNS
jgi:hypothetical protein